MDRNQAAMEHLNVAKPAYLIGDYAVALTALHAAEQASPDWPVRGHVLQTMAVNLQESGRPQEAEVYWERFFAELVPGQYPALAAALAHYNRGYCSRLLGRYDEALAAYGRALVTFRREGQYVVKCLHNITWTACMAGDRAAAQAAHNAAAPLEMDSEDRYNHRLNAAFLAVLDGLNARAGEICHEILGDPEAPRAGRSHACWLLGDLALAAGDLQGAAAWATQGEQLAQGDPCEARLLHDLGSLRKAISKAS